MKTRTMTGAFLCYGNEVLLMHRNPDRKIAPDMWAPVGGHIEPDEIDDPKAACLREIEEETGIRAENIKNLNLRYITTRKFEDEIRFVFFFMGEVAEKYDLPVCGEGVLHWMDFESLPELHMPFSTKQTILHWGKNEDSESIHIGVINSTNDEITWSQL